MERASKVVQTSLVHFPVQRAAAARLRRHVENRDVKTLFGFRYTAAESQIAFPTQIRSGWLHSAVAC